MKITTSAAEEHRAREYFDSLWSDTTALPLSFDIGNTHFHGFGNDSSVAASEIIRGSIANVGKSTICSLLKKKRSKN